MRAQGVSTKEKHTVAVSSGTHCSEVGFEEGCFDTTLAAIGRSNGAAFTKSPAVSQHDRNIRKAEPNILT